VILLDCSYSQYSLYISFSIFIMFGKKAATRTTAAILSFLVLSCLPSSNVVVHAQNGIVREPGFQFSTVMTGMERPTDMAFLPDGRILVTERAGGVYLYNANFQRITKVLSLEAVTCNNCAERGLISMVLHPNFAENGYVYLYWVHVNTQTGSCECEISNNIAAPTNRLSRFTMVGNTIDFNSQYIMFETSPMGSMHSGGGCAFGADGYLYIATGDGKYPTNGNNPANHPNNLMGKVLRITDTGEPAPGNPFMNDPNSIRCNTRRFANAGGQGTKCQEVYHLGFRNPFGLAMDPNMKDPNHIRYMIGDVGSETWEDISLAESGPGFPSKHYGWPVYEGPCHESRSGGGSCNINNDYEQPLHFYDRPGPEGQTGAAITAGCFIPNGIWPQQYDGAYFYADLRRGRIYHMKYDPNRGCRGAQCPRQISQYVPVPIVEDEDPTRTHPLGSPLRLRFGSIDTNAMYMLTYNADGKIYKLINTQDPNRSPTAVIADLLYSVDAATGGITVTFDGRESVDPDGHAMAYEWDFGIDGVAKGTGPLVSHTYVNAGRYTATLTVEDERGVKNSKTVDIDTRNDLQPLETFEWKEGNGDCPAGYDACGVLEFCQNAFTRTISYGYRTPSCVSKGCLPGRSPVIRIQPGKKYKLTLHNAAPNGVAPTNLHTHGLHISGSGDADNVLREAHGGECLDYTWDIPADHPPGTYWYHSHHHEASLAQVGGGAYGLLIVDDKKQGVGNNSPPDWAFNELLLQVSADNSAKVMANGAHYEIFSIQANQWYRLRVSIVDPIAIPRELVFTQGCQVHRVASDGIWHSMIPGEQSNTYEMTGASRGDFAIRCGLNGTPNGAINIRWHGTVVAIVDIGSPALIPHTMTTWVPTRPFSLSGIASAIVPDENKFDITIQRATLNSLAWNPTVPLTTINYNEVHEWTISNSENHPFHTHLYHMMIVTEGGCGAHKQGEFYDTISGPPCTVRFKAADIGEMMVMHCHVMQHSDSGAMAWVDVNGPGMPVNNELADPFTCNVREQLGCPPAMAPTLPPIIRDETYLLFAKDDEVLGGQAKSSTPPGYSYRQYTDGRAVVLLGDFVVWEKTEEASMLYQEGEWVSKLQGDCNFLIRKDGAMQWKSDTRALNAANCFVGIYLGDDNQLKIGLREGDVDNPGAVYWEEDVLEFVTLNPTTEPSAKPSASPTASPTALPSIAPTAMPSVLASPAPSFAPTTQEETMVPTAEPTRKRLASPTKPLSLDLTLGLEDLNVLADANTHVNVSASTATSVLSFTTFTTMALTVALSAVMMYH